MIAKFDMPHKVSQWEVPFVWGGVCAYGVVPIVYESMGQAASPYYSTVYCTIGSV